MYDYDIALSFSMEEKDLVEQVYHYLRAEGISVFFAPAPECQEVLSGRNQREVFYEIFGLKAENVALFVSPSYLTRKVTMEECEIALSKHCLDGKVIPIYLDGAELPRTLFDPSLTNYFKPNVKSAIEIAVHLAGKINNKNARIAKVEEKSNNTMHVSNNSAEKMIVVQKIEGNISL